MILFKKSRRDQNRQTQFLKRVLQLTHLCTLIFLLSSCQNKQVSLWEDAKTAGRFINKKIVSLWQEENESRAIQSFNQLIGPQEEEFIPLQEQDKSSQKIDDAVLQPKYLPSEEEMLSIDRFRSPSHDLALIFRTLYFNTDQHEFQSKEYFSIVHKIADYLKSHPHLYVFIEGHCDERASEAYNLALGMKRSNYIKLLLLKEGVLANQVYTISYGKERPVDLKHTPDAWVKNRRAEFKIYEKRNQPLKIYK